MARRIGVFSTGDLPLILVSGVEEMKGAIVLFHTKHTIVY